MNTSPPPSRPSSPSIFATIAEQHATEAEVNGNDETFTALLDQAIADSSSPPAGSDGDETMSPASSDGTVDQTPPSMKRTYHVAPGAPVKTDKDSLYILPPIPPLRVQSELVLQPLFASLGEPSHDVNIRYEQASYEADGYMHSKEIIEFDVARIRDKIVIYCALRFILMPTGDEMKQLITSYISYVLLIVKSGEYDMNEMARYLSVYLYNNLRKNQKAALFPKRKVISVDP